MWKVSYIHLKGYRVSRMFDTQEAAQEFIDTNALVAPLPGVKLISEAEANARRVVVSRMAKMTLAQMHANNGGLMGTATYAKWSKDELVRAILEDEGLV